MGAWRNVIWWRLIRVSVFVFNSGVRRQDYVAILKVGDCRNEQPDWGKPLGCPERFVSQETILCNLTREHPVNMYPIIPNNCFTRAQQDRFCHACSVVSANGRFPFAKSQSIKLPTEQTDLKRIISI